eukprot:Nk52_evm57s554 gene=Nk52_evmTU57s554
MSLKFGKVVISEQNQVFRKTALSYAFTNLMPIVDGHVLVAPKRCIKRFYELTEEEISDLFKLVQEVGEVVEGFYKASSLTISVQDGKEAGQTIDHVHVHVIPRRKDDFNRNDEIYEQLEKHDKDPERVPRSDEEMAKEAEHLRNYSITR